MLIPWNSLISKTRFLLSWSKEEEDLFRSCPGEWTLECRQHHRGRGTNDLTNFSYCVLNCGPAPVPLFYTTQQAVWQNTILLHMHWSSYKENQTERGLLEFYVEDVWQFMDLSTGPPVQDQDIWNTVICLFMINQISSFGPFRLHLPKILLLHHRPLSNIVIAFNQNWCTAGASYWATDWKDTRIRSLLRCRLFLWKNIVKP